MKILTHAPPPPTPEPTFTGKRATEVVGLALGSVALPFAATDAVIARTAPPAKRPEPLETVHVEPARDPDSSERRIELTIRDEEGRVLRALDRVDRPFTIEAEVRGWRGLAASLSMDGTAIGRIQVTYENTFLRARVPIAPAAGEHRVTLDLDSIDGRYEPPEISVQFTAKFGTPLPDYGDAIRDRVTLEMNDAGFPHPDDVLELGPFRVERALVRTILDSAQETGTDPIVMMAIAEKESGFRPSVEASTSTAAGLYQFIEQTWLSIIADAGKKHGLAREAEQIAYDPLSRKYWVVAPHARDPECTDLVKAHLCDLIGVDEAEVFLDALRTDPGQSAPKLLPRVAELHPGLFFSTSRKKRHSRSVGATYAKILQRISSAPERARILQLRADPRLSALLAAELWKRDCGLISDAIGRPVTKAETYLCHFMGVNGATRFLRALADDPNQSAAKLMPSAANANRSIFYERSGGKRRSRSVASVYAHLIGMMTSRFERYRDVVALAEAPLARNRSGSAPASD